MALEIVRDPGSGAYVEARIRLYLTDSGEFVGEDYAGPERKRLYCGVGQRILRDDAKRDGLLDLDAELADEPDDDEGQSDPSSDDESESGDDDEQRAGDESDAGDDAVAEPEKPKPDTKAVRAWAKEQGLDVPARGKIPDEVYELYAEARAEGGEEQ